MNIQQRFPRLPPGVVLNGQKLMELAAEGDGRVKIEGDVELETKPLRPYPVCVL